MFDNLGMCHNFARVTKNIARNLVYVINLIDFVGERRAEIARPLFFQTKLVYNINLMSNFQKQVQPLKNKYFCPLSLKFSGQ